MTNEEMLHEVKKELKDILQRYSAEVIPFLNLGEREEIFAVRILSLSTTTCRIVVVRKEGKLPRNVYATSVPAEFQTKEGFDLWVAYGESQQDMLKAGYVQEVKDDHDVRR